MLVWLKIIAWITSLVKLVGDDNNVPQIGFRSHYIGKLMNEKDLKVFVLVYKRHIIRISCSCDWMKARVLHGNTYLRNIWGCLCLQAIRTRVLFLAWTQAVPRMNSYVYWAHELVRSDVGPHLCSSLIIEYKKRHVNLVDNITQEKK